MAAFENPAFDDHERVVYCSDRASGLKAIIAIHSTALGPAAGGCRLWGYESDDAALTDVLRLSQGMSYKNAMAGLNFGGGKAVIIKTPDFSGSEALYEKFGEFVEHLNGDYVTAEDVGMSVSIMQTIGRRTKYVSGLPHKEGHAGGDPSPKTSWGIFKGIDPAAIDPATMMPITASQNISHDRKLSAKVKIIGMNITSKMIPMPPPINDAAMAIPSAWPPSPRWANWWPSIIVGTASGVPGMFIRTAEIAPPNTLPV